MQLEKYARHATWWDSPGHFYPSVLLSYNSEWCDVMATERILFIYRYIYVIYIKYIEIIIYIYYTLSYNIYIFTHIWTRQVYGDFIHGTVLLEKCFNFHILVRWHLPSHLVKRVEHGSEHCAQGAHILSAEVFSRKRSAIGLWQRAFCLGARGEEQRDRDLTLKLLSPLRCLSPAHRERERENG